MTKCRWALVSAPEECYHDNEWGVPLHDDIKLFEFLVLEGAQAGLSWRTILGKREGYRLAFDGFDAEKIAVYDEHKFNELLSNSDIVRNRLKIQAAIANARAFIRVRDAFGSFDAYIWQFVGDTPKQNAWTSPSQVPSFSIESECMSRDLLQRGFKFVGKTICYAYMQAVGMVNDHTTDCFRHAQISKLSNP
jgi:DNA-3-methyladenine glycosylase I